MFILSIGFFFTLFTVDLKVLDFKFKGIFAYIMLGTGFFQLLYPIKTIDDFILVNTVGLLYGLVAVILPIIFFYVGFKTRSLRSSAYSIAVGIIIYTIGGTVFNQAIIDPLINLYGEGIIIVFYFLFLLFKTIGISVFAYGVVNFRL
ncbi:MAG: hypothetical protein GF383_10195 [Candidatus Lokiarchaeota archaeon]|nr:hypothetical protein [Candidatus Lokiarchaeota archaeon]MBD3340932.1 hypothetical protein [Candidatus Lokiarchaeota archaeon]